MKYFYVFKQANWWNLVHIEGIVVIIMNNFYYETNPDIAKNKSAALYK